VQKSCFWLVLTTCADKSAADLAEDGADVAGHGWHDRPGCYRDKACHQGVLDQVLPLGITPECAVYEPPNMTSHSFSSFPI
jgi:hypothetical protein